VTAPGTGNPAEWLERPSTLVLPGKSVALVHEWYGQSGGAEKVFLHIGQLLPHAERFVLWTEEGATADPGFRQSWLARTPLRASKALALPFMPVVWRTLTRSTFNVVISSSHAFAHTVRLGSADGTRYLSYVHSPARYVWSPNLDGRGAGPMLAGPRRVLQAADVRLSRHVHSYAANSREVRDRIRRFWGRDAEVIHPPVAVDFYATPPDSVRRQSRDYLLGVGRWIRYKNFDLMIEIAAAARMPLVIAGAGPEEAALRRAAAKVDVPVTFEVRPDDERLRQLYWGARALLFPTHEDFGIIPVEAQSCGTPVLGFARGGLLETVVDGETGFLIQSTRARDFAPLVARVDELHEERIRAQASAFSPQVFAAKLTTWVSDATA